MTVRVLQGDCRALLATLPGASVQCVVTSPPYFGLRDYGTGTWAGGDVACGHIDLAASATRRDADRARPTAGPTRGGSASAVAAHYRDTCGKCGATRTDAQIGLEPSPDAYVAALVGVFREVRRCLRDDGCLFLNLGDSYADKQLQMIPARVALALQADGWWLRSDIIWAKPNPMPESVTDRPTSSHEHVFLLTKRATYYYDADAVREPASSDPSDSKRGDGGAYAVGSGRNDTGTHMGVSANGKRNCRNVWTLATEPYSGAHFAVFPTELAERCIKAGSKPGDTILDPFAGAFTTALVADRLQRDAIGIELSEAYCTMARNRLLDDAGMFANVAD